MGGSPETRLPSQLFTPLDISSEAYCLADIGRRYAIYFPDGRHAIELDPWVLADTMTLRWLDIERGAWSDETVLRIEHESLDPAWSLSRFRRGCQWNIWISLATPLGSNYQCIMLVWFTRVITTTHGADWLFSSS